MLESGAAHSGAIARKINGQRHNVNRRSEIYAGNAQGIENLRTASPRSISTFDFGAIDRGSGAGECGRVRWEGSW
jgi:hypothetical protein